MNYSVWDDFSSAFIGDSNNIKNYIYDILYAIVYFYVKSKMYKLYREKYVLQRIFIY